MFPYFNCLLYGSHTANLRTVEISGFLITRAYAVYDSHSFWFDPGSCQSLALIEHLLEISRCDHIIVYTVSVLLFFSRIEKIETGSNHNRISFYGT